MGVRRISARVMRGLLAVAMLSLLSGQTCVPAPPSSTADADGDGVVDAQDGCPDDPAKTDEGECGCGVVDVDTDGDGAFDCQDAYPDDPTRWAYEGCGCGGN